MPDQDNKKLDYLKRGDVRTMEKDTARLREKESEIARGKMAQIKTEEEMRREYGRQEQAARSAQERERLEVQIKSREEESVRLRETREEAAGLSAEALVRTEEEEKERLRAEFKEAQSKEEEERRKFLEKVAQQSGEETAPVWPPAPPPIPQRPAPPTPPPVPQRPPSPPSPPAIQPTAPVPPVPPMPPTPVQPPMPVPEIPAVPQYPKKPFKFPSFKFLKPKLPSVQMPRVSLPKISMPKVQIPKVEGYFPAKPSVLEKIWVRIIISLFILAILTTLITFWYWYLVVRPASATPPAIEGEPPAPVAEPKEPEITQGFIGTGYYFPAAPRVIDTIIIHSGFNTSNNDPYDIEGIIQSYKKAGVATHYLISREGSIFQLAPDYAIAYHAGIGKMPDGRSGVNNFSAGISLVYQETEGPNDLQYQSLSWLVKELQSKYNIPSENILGYKDIAPGKTTPWNFDRDKLKLLFSFLSFGPESNRGAEFILQNLTLEEKTGQLLIVGFDGTKLTTELEGFIKSVRPGGVILFRKNIETPSQVKKLIQDLQKISLAETDLPLFIAVDQEGGVVSRISFIQEKTGQSEIENADQAYQIGLERGKELKSLGINLNLAPVLDLAQAGDFLYERSFQKNSEETGSLAKALVLGQKTAEILTAIKHFPGYGGIPSDPEERLITLTDEPETSHFQKAMSANPEFVMLASVVDPDFDVNMPIAFSAKGVSSLKKDLGSAPLIITDDLLQKSFTDNFTLKEIVSLPIGAGADVLLFSSWKEKIKDASAALIETVQAGDLSEKLIDKAVLRIIRLKLSF